jgi:hypothetical protein
VKHRFLWMLIAVAVGASGARPPLDAQSAAATPPSSQPLTPLVIVVHGIGDVNREDGWSTRVTKAWGVNPADVREINFGYEGRGRVDSYEDFGKMAQPWAEHVQLEMARHLADPANAGRPVIVVSHSWGTVMTKVAIEGGVTKSGVVHPLDDALPAHAKAGGKPVDHLFTLGSPLGRDSRALDLRQIGITTERGKPASVRQWTNVFAPDDPVSTDSWDLDGADENVRLDRAWYSELPVVGRPLGLLSHMFIWTNQEVVRRVQGAYAALQAPQTLTVNAVSTDPWAVVGLASAVAEGPVSRSAGPAALVVLRDLPPAHYVVTASANGFAARSQPVLVTARGPNRITIALSPAPLVDKPVAERVEARVIDRVTGKPVAGATVALSGPASRSAVSTADGSVIIEGVPHGLYTIAAFASGYQRSSRDGFEVSTSLRGTVRLTPVDDAKPPVAAIGESLAAAGSEQFATLGAGLPESSGGPTPSVPVGTFSAPGPGSLQISFTYRGAPRPDLQYATGYGQGYRTEARLSWSGRVVTGDSLAAGELRGKGETTKTLPITVRGAGDVIFTAVGEWTIARQIDGKWFDGPGGDRRHYLPGEVTVTLRFVPAK